MKSIFLKVLFVSTSLLLVTSSTSAMTCTTLTKSLAKSSSDSEVLKLQQFLFDGGYLTAKPNGYFGSGTVTALKKFQIAQGMSPVGTTGPKTRGKVKEVSCKKVITESQTSSVTSLSGPAKVLADTRNAQRRSDVTTILNAVYQYAVDNNGAMPSTIVLVPIEICATTGAACTHSIDLGVLTLNQKYLITMPTDPQRTSLKGSGYTIEATSNGRMRVSAPLAEEGAVISVMR